MQTLPQTARPQAEGGACRQETPRRTARADATHKTLNSRRNPPTAPLAQPRYSLLTLPPNLWPWLDEKIRAGVKPKVDTGTAKESKEAEKV